MLQRQTARTSATALFVIGLVMGCGADPPTPVPTPTPLPTVTPIPGYVSGEEDAAYTSFLAYYQKEVFDCYWDPTIYVEVQLDLDYPGKAIYIGDGIWRFYLQVYSREGFPREDGFVFSEWTSKEEIRDVQSFADRTWGNVCTRWNEDDHREDAEYKQDYPDEPVDEEPPEQEWP